MLPPFSCENVHLQRSWGEGRTVWEGKEHPKAWLLPSLPVGLQVMGLLPLAETCGDCPMLDLGMLGKGAKLTEGLGR